MDVARVRSGAPRRPARRRSSCATRPRARPAAAAPVLKVHRLTGALEVVASCCWPPPWSTPSPATCSAPACMAVLSRSSRACRSCCTWSASCSRGGWRDAAAAARRAPCLARCVVLTMGNRPAELARALPSRCCDQDGDPVEMVVVGNGVDVDRAARRACARWRCRRTSASRPAATSADARPTSGDVVLFLDDDGWLPDAGTAAAVARAVRRRPRLGIVSLRIARPGDRPARSAGTCRGCAPRDPERSSEVTTFLGGASVVRRAVLDAGRAAAGGVLLRARGDRPRLARAGRRLADPLRRRRRRCATRRPRRAARRRTTG